MQNLLFRGCWVEDNVVDALDELELHHALDGEQAEELPAVRGVQGGADARTVGVVARRWKT